MNFFDMLKAGPTKYLTRKPKKSGKGYDYTYKDDAKTKKPWMDSFIGLFGFKDKVEAGKRIQQDYKDNSIKEKFGLSVMDWHDHLKEYFSNKSKWDSFFTKGKSKKDKEKKTVDKIKDKKIEKKVKKDGLKLSAMKFIQGLYGDIKPPPTAKEIKVKKDKQRAEMKRISTETESKTIATEDGSKIETNVTLTPEQAKEEIADEDIANREGYFNEKPSDIMNVGADVWGAARHNFDTYEVFNADINKMEKEGTAYKYVTKKTLMGDFGLANKDERVANGETEFKVLASFAIRDYLEKIPENTELSRQQYVEFTRAIIRLDDNTTSANEFYFGLSEIFQGIFPQKAPDEGNLGILSMIEETGKGAETIGAVLKSFLNSLSGVKDESTFYSLDKKERKQFKNLTEILFSETEKGTKTYDELKGNILGQAKAAGLKIKKGDNITLTDTLKERVYVTSSSFETPEKQEKHYEAVREVNKLYDFTIPYNFDSFPDEDRRKYGKSFEDYFDKQFNSKAEVSEAINEAITKFRKVATDNIIRTRIYPETVGQVIRAGKDSVDVSFEFPDGKVRSWQVKASDIKNEDVESIKKKGNTKSTQRLNLYVESKVERVGGTDFAELNVKDAQAALTKDFNLKAVQYGNSMPEDERAYHTQWTIQSFSDLADVLGLPMEQISAGNKLGMAFGARGKGGALAHYEPGTKMINLTRANGFGSLAHEWGHFMDNILSEGMQGYISQEPKYNVQKVSKENIKHGSVYRHEVIKRNKKVVTNYFYDEDAPNKSYPFVKLNTGEIKPGDKPQYSNLYWYSNGREMDVDVPEPVAYLDLAREIAEESNNSLWGQTLKAIEDDPSKKEFLTKAVLESAYLQSDVECFARAFESYVADKLEDNGRKNTYLSSKAKTIGKDGKLVYPQKEYRAKISKLFDKFFDEIRTGEELKKALSKLKVKFNPESGQYIYRAFEDKRA